MTSQQTDTSKNEDKITVMVIVICILFMVLTTPLTAVFIIVYNGGLYVYMGPEIELYNYIILLLALSNHAINFLLYSITSSNFRNELKNIWKEVKGQRARNRLEDKDTKQN